MPPSIPGRDRAFPAAFLLAFALAGCRSEPLSVRTFVLGYPPRPAVADAADPPAPSIALEGVRVNPVYNQNRILLRGGEGGREVHWLEGGTARWVLLPGDMVFECVLRDLRESNRFSRVFLQNQRSADYSLRLEVATLEVRVAEDGAAEATCEVDALLVRNAREAGAGREPELVWTGHKRGRVALADRSTETAVNALGEALAAALAPPDGILAGVYDCARARPAPPARQEPSPR